jgi:hypothetical protein
MGEQVAKGTNSNETERTSSEGHLVIEHEKNAPKRRRQEETSEEAAVNWCELISRVRSDGSLRIEEQRIASFERHLSLLLTAFSVLEAKMAKCD